MSGKNMVISYVHTSALFRAFREDALQDAGENTRMTAQFQSTSPGFNATESKKRI